MLENTRYGAPDVPGDLLARADVLDASGRLRDRLAALSLLAKFTGFTVGVFLFAVVLDVAGGPPSAGGDPLNLFAGLLGAVGVLLAGIAVGATVVRWWL